MDEKLQEENKRLRALLLRAASWIEAGNGLIMQLDGDEMDDEECVAFVSMLRDVATGRISAPAQD